MCLESEYVNLKPQKGEILVIKYKNSPCQFETHRGKILAKDIKKHPIKPHRGDIL